MPVLIFYCLHLQSAGFDNPERTFAAHLCGKVSSGLAGVAVPDISPFTVEEIAERLIRQPALAGNYIAARGERHVGKARTAVGSTDTQISAEFIIGPAG